jgi:[FeFe] hydrogenase (group B1/B3)
MFYANSATRLHKEILIRVANAFYSANKIVGLNRIPIEMRPKDEDFTRCCLYKDRAIIKYRCMAALGVGYDEEVDELMLIGDYLEKVENRQKPADHNLSVITEACSACIKTSYMVTNACMGCIAKSCQSACPRDAIDMVNGHALIDKDKCINCGLCMKACPYHAIIYIPTPCEAACPVGAITKDPETGKEEIDEDKCIYCGKCMKECPFAAISGKSQMVDVMNRIDKGDKVVAMVAPSISGQFPGTYGQIFASIKQLGFNDVFEVALGADKTTEHEAEEFIERMAAGDPIMTTSCCPAYIQAIKKIVPELEPYASTTATPMGFAGQMVKEQYKDVVSVFIGPCLAKRAEASTNDDIDYVLTFEELAAMLIGKKIDVLEIEADDDISTAKKTSHGFAAAGGVTQAIKDAAGDIEIKPFPINGLTKKGVALLKMAAKGKCPGNLMEVMVCDGGCLAGPGTNVSPKSSSKVLKAKVEKTPGQW